MLYEGLSQRGGGGHLAQLNTKLKKANVELPYSNLMRGLFVPLRREALDRWRPSPVRRACVHASSGRDSPIRHPAQPWRAASRTEHGAPSIQREHKLAHQLSNQWLASRRCSQPPISAEGLPPAYGIPTLDSTRYRARQSRFTIFRAFVRTPHSRRRRLTEITCASRTPVTLLQHHLTDTLLRMR